MKIPRTDESPNRWTARRTVLVAVLSSAAALLLAAPYVMVANPTLCGVCHEMRPYVESWEGSTHSAAARDCAACHAAPGLAGGFVYRMGLYREFASAVTGPGFVAGHAAIPGISSCLRAGCHSANRETSPSGDLKIGHRVHIEDAGLACVRCHPGAAHKGVDDRRLTPPMKTCKGCHEQEMEYCSFCHSRPMGPQDVTAAPLAH